MMKASTRAREATRATSMLVAVLLALVAAPIGAAAHPGGALAGDGHEPVGLNVVVNSPAALAGAFPAVQWTGSAEVDGQTAELAYAGSGCTPASYLAADVAGRIALVDPGSSSTNPVDQCPAYAFVQKVQSAQAAGAVGLIEIAPLDETPSGGDALTADIPAVEVERTDEMVAVRDAVIDGTTVEASLVNNVEPVEPMSDVPCVDGRAGPFECSGVDLLALVPQEDFNGAGVSDLWGWTDPDSGDEYVILGKTNGVAFFRITDPTAPVYLGELPNPAVLPQVWHDIKVYDNHAFVVSESEPHGMEVFDLTRLRDVQEPREWDADAVYPLNVAAHNLEINTDTGFAYIVGGNAGLVVPDQCLSGLHMVDINEPKQPTFAGCYLEEGGPGTAARTVGEPTVMDNSPMAYVHDAQCVVYDGPDEDHTGREVCFNAAEDGVVIADVTDKLSPTTLGTTEYPHMGYTHQGWLTEDHRYLILNDELDELERDEVTNTRTIVLDVTDLDDPKVHFEHFHEGEAVTHNNYVHEGFVYQSNYSAGLRILDVADVADRTLQEVAFFDTYPTDNATNFDGTWSNYPFFESGTIAVSGRAEGLFLLRVHDDVLDRVRPDVVLLCRDCPAGIRAGERETTFLLVRNVGTVDDTYEVTVDRLPEGWRATVDPATVSVAPTRGAEVDLVIHVPPQARQGTYTVGVTASSLQHPDVSASKRITVRVRDHQPPGRGRAQAPSQAQAQAGTTSPGRPAVPSAVPATAAASPSDGAPVSTWAILALGLVVLAASRVRRAMTR